MSHENVKERKMGKKKMVGGVPMATIYKGMNLHRFNALSQLESEAFFRAYDEMEMIEGPAFDECQAKHFDQLMARYSTKAGWHANHKDKV